VASSALRALQRIGPAAAAAAPYVAELAEAHPYGAGTASPVLRSLGAGESLPPAPKAGDLPSLLKKLAAADPEAAGKAAFAIGRLAPQDDATREALTFAVKRKAPYVRRHASLALLRIGPSCAPALMELLAQRQVVVRRLAAEALWHLAAEVGMAALPAWQRALDDTDSHVRGYACGAIGVIGPDARAAIPRLVAALSDKDITVAKSAAWSLGRMKIASSGTVAALAGVLLEREEPGSFRWIILVALGELGAASEPAVPAIRELLRREESLRQPVVDALVKIGPAGHAALVEIVRDERGFTRQVALQRLLHARSHPPGLRAALEQAAQDEDSTTRQTALIALQRLKPDGESSIAALVASLRKEQIRALRHSQVPTALAAQANPSELCELAVHADERVRWAALRALCLKKAAEYSKADRDRIRRLVRRRLADKSVMVRNIAGSLLLRVPPTEVTPEWIRWAGEFTDENARRAIGAALATVGVRAVPALSRALAGEDRAMRIGAASVIAALGPVAKTTAPALSNALLQNDEDTRLYVRALIAIGGDALSVWTTTYAGVKDKTSAMLLGHAIVQQGADAVPHLEKLREGGKGPTRMWTVSMLSRIGEPALDSLLAAASDTDAYTARLAIDGLGRIRGHVPRIAPVLVGALRRREVRSAAANALRGQGEAAFPYLEKAADDDDAGTRAGAYAAIASFGERAIPLLRRGIADVDKEARAAAVRAAGSLNRALVPELIKALRDENGDVRIKAASALGRLKPVPVPALPELLRVFRVGSRFERRATHQALIALNAASQIAPLLADDDRSLRSDASTLLVKMRTDAVPSLVALIKSHEDPARKMGVATLARMGAQDALVGLLREKDPAVRAAAAHGLGIMRNRARGAVPVLVEALDDSDAAVRKEAVWAIGEIGPAAEDAIPALRARIKASEDRTREAAIAVLARVGAWEDLAELLLDRDPAVRAAAARGLGTMGRRARDAVPALVEVLKDSEAAVTQEALRALGQIGPAAKDATPALLAWIRAHQDPTRQGAVAALVRIGARDALVELLHEKDRSVRASAARGLGRMRSKAQAAVPALIEALGDPSAAVSKEAVRALGAVGPGAKAAIPALRALHGKGRHVMLIEATLAKIHGGR
jgi:HEAT repeat protein